MLCVGHYSIHSCLPAATDINSLYTLTVKNLSKLKMELLINNVDIFLKSIVISNWFWDTLMSFSFYFIPLMWYGIEIFQRKRKCKLNIVSFTLPNWWDIRIILDGSIILTSVEIPSCIMNCGSHNFCWQLSTVQRLLYHSCCSSNCQKIFGGENRPVFCGGVLFLLHKCYDNYAALRDGWILNLIVLCTRE